MKPIAWYDPSNGVVSTDRDSPLFTPLGQVWPLYPKREWVGLTDEDYRKLHFEIGPTYFYQDYGQAIEAKLKEKNT